ncbi:serine hydrolase domain-containing protein [Algoriphagus namhaensis]
MKTNILYLNTSYLWKKCLWVSLLVLIYPSIVAQTLSKDLYFPPKDSGNWERVDLNSLSWDNEALAELLAWLPRSGTRSFVILKNGKLVVEEYWGAKLTGMGDMDQQSVWYWASAGKTLTAGLLGIAEEEKSLRVKDPVSDYLGEDWTSMPVEAERNILISHLLSMSSGLDERIERPDETNPENLTFFAPAGKRWAYHQAPYFLLMDLLEKASGKTVNDYFQSTLGRAIGMNGFWQNTGKQRLFFSDARSMARYGLLLLNRGEWAGEEIIPTRYVDRMLASSQSDNPSYGYLTWINSTDGLKLPGYQVRLKRQLLPGGSQRAFMALGKNGQILLVLPEEGIVLVRMGSSSSENEIQESFLKEFWVKFQKVLD